MVFENLTLVELNLENARIGPRFGEEDEAPAGSADGAEGDDSGGSRLGPLFGFLVLVGLGVALGYRRYRSGAGSVGSEGEQITIESAAEQ